MVDARGTLPPASGGKTRAQFIRTPAIGQRRAHANHIATIRPSGEHGMGLMRSLGGQIVTENTADAARPFFRWQKVEARRRARVSWRNRARARHVLNVTLAQGDERGILGHESKGIDKRLHAPVQVVGSKMQVFQALSVAVVIKGLAQLTQRIEAGWR